MKNIKLVTVDVWDTLVRRACHPDAVKIHVCRFLLFNYYDLLNSSSKDITSLLHARQAAEAEIGVAQCLAGFDDEYNLRDVYALWLNKVFSSVIDSDSVTSELYEAELAQEYLVSYRDPNITNILDQYPSAKKVFVSDFYMGVAELKSILAKLGFDGLVTSGYSSCDVLLNKRSGNLFPYVLKREDVESKSVIHIGDNIHSDVNVPRKIGIDAVHYLPEAEHQLRLARERNFGNPHAIINNVLSDLIEGFPLIGVGRRAAELYACGIKSSYLLVGFVLYVMEQSIKHGHERVFFFTREGELFKDIYDALAAQDPFGIKPPEAVLLEVSRVATFSPSMADVSISSLMRIWTLYSTQSIGALFSSLDVSCTQFLGFFTKYNLTISEDIQYPWLDERVISLFSDADFIGDINSLIEVKKKNLLGYLASKEFPTKGKAAVVDIGWRGTIQDNLSYLFPEVLVDGYYLGLDRFLNPQLANVRKFSFGPNLNEEVALHASIFTKVSPIEMLCNSPNGSTVGYSFSAGVYSAERVIQDSENFSYHDSVVYFQQGVIQAAVEISKVVRLHAISSECIKEIAVACWNDIVLNPAPVIADAYFKLNHNESFGLGRFDDKALIIPLAVWIKAIFSISGMRMLVRRLEETGWPEGYLAQRRLGWVWRFINFARLVKQKIHRVK